jgi:endo-alpha-1,4-polygalactosaminidase (GH114 family)
MKKHFLWIVILLLTGCRSGSSTDAIPEEGTTGYGIHKNITVTIFWTGENASSANRNIPNLVSAWDDMWMLNYGGVDDPNNRNGYYPLGFTPDENPFYFALPFNDFDENGKKKTDLSSYIPWVNAESNNTDSVCKNRWIRITKEGKSVYAQWEDVGPFGEDDREYVFGNRKPKNMINNNAGLDVSPAVRDYLGLSDIDVVDWEFVDEADVPDGPWKEILTVSGTNWVEWYQPGINTSWQWQLQGRVNTSYDVEIYDIDLFDSDTTLINALKDNGKKVICYFSAGSYEEWREDASDFPSDILGNNLDGWAGERWLDIRSSTLRSIMKSRLDLAVKKGCDGVEPDNMDGYTNDTGFNLSADDQLIYNKFIANEARKRGLSVGLKNDLNQIQELEPFFDFSLNEQCHQYGECDSMQPFIDAGKPVLIAEYAQEYVDNSNGERDKMCADSRALQFRTLVLPIALDDSFRYSCD